MSETHKTNLFLSLYGTNKPESCVVVTGVIDTSQTTVCRMLLKGSMENPSEPLIDLYRYEDNRLESILQNLVVLGKYSEERTKKEGVYQFIIFLLNAMNDGESALLVIDDTQNILLPLMEQTRVLSRMESQNKKLLQVILLGQKKKCIQSIHSSQLKQSYQRISVSQQSDKFTIDEIKKYIENRLTRDGAKDGICFSTEALSFIRNNSLGIPRMVSLIHDNVLLNVHNKKTIEIKEKIVENTVENLKFPIKDKKTEGEKHQFVKVKPEKKLLNKLTVLKFAVKNRTSINIEESKRLKKKYLIGFGILTMIIAGVIIYLSGRTWHSLTMFNLP